MPSSTSYFMLAFALGVACLASSGCGSVQTDGGPDSPRGVLELPPPRGEQEWATLWDDLASEDAARAYRALCRLALHPRESVPFLKARLRPASPDDSRAVARLVVALDDESFDEREKAQKR